MRFLLGSRIGTAASESPLRTAAAAAASAACCLKPPAKPRGRGEHRHPKAALLLCVLVMASAVNAAHARALWPESERACSLILGCCDWLI